MLSKQENSMKKKYYMAYAAAGKIGLLKLPLDGNPHNSLSVIGHPGGVSSTLKTH